MSDLVANSEDKSASKSDENKRLSERGEISKEAVLAAKEEEEEEEVEEKKKVKKRKKKKEKEEKKKGRKSKEEAKTKCDSSSPERKSAGEIHSTALWTVFHSVSQCLTVVFKSDLLNTPLITQKHTQQLFWTI